MLDFTIPQKAFASICRIMTQSRTASDDEMIDVICSAQTVKFVVTGRDSTSSAVVGATGQAQFPLALLPRIKKAAATFETETVRFRIDSGRIRINSMSLSNPDITVGKINDRAIDIPDDAPSLDILALQFLFTPDEIAASNLEGRLVEAAKARLKALKSAATSVEPFGITQDALDALMKNAIRMRAEMLQPILKPRPLSQRPN